MDDLCGGSLGNAKIKEIKEIEKYPIKKNKETAAAVAAAAAAVVGN